jgi:Tfp pilus assembly protein PilF
MSERRFNGLLFALLLGGLGVRLGYVLAQPGSDPTFDRPLLDGEYYLGIAREWAEGRSGPEGAFYLAPLYPMLLLLMLRVVGESFGLLYLLQHVAVLGTAALCALTLRRLVDGPSGLAAAALLLLYGPALFFASRPLGESWSLLLLAGGLWLLATREGGVSTALAGLLSGVAALARPNLLAVTLVWAVREAWRRRPLAAGLLLLGTALALLPVTVHNGLASGHLVPISGNMGITLFHGNGEGAAGVYTPPWRFGGALPVLQREATLQASLQSGRELDPIEADRWWARRAVAERLRDPGGSVVLLGKKLGFLLAHEELGLDYDPGLDRNPWRFGAPLGFAVVLGLAAAGLVLVGFKGSGGWRVWGAVAACAATPLIFYMSSRYRLPTAVLLCLPAGVALPALWRELRRGPSRRTWIALAVGVACAAGSWAIPIGFTGEELRAGALANRAVAWKARGDLAAAERDLREALAFDPDTRRMASVAALYTLGVVLDARGDAGGSEEAYVRALTIDPSHVESAANLAALLIRQQRAGGAIAALRTALAERPDHRPAWSNLVVALAALGDLAAAREAAREAASYGIDLDPALLRTIGAQPIAPAEEP